MKKALVLWSLLLVLALLAGCGSQTADNGNDTPNNDAVTDSQDNVPADNAGGWSGQHPGGQRSCGLSRPV